MKTKIKSALVNKYKNLGIDDKVFDGVADIISQTVTEEAGIDAAVAGVEGWLKTVQGATDRLRGENASLRKQLEEGGTKPEPKKEGDDSAVAAALKKIMERMDAQDREFSTFKAERAREAMYGAAKTKLAAEGITIGDDAVSKKAWAIATSGMTSEATVDELVTRVKQEFTELTEISGSRGYSPMEGAGGNDDKADERFAAMYERLKAKGEIN